MPCCPLLRCPGRAPEPAGHPTTERQPGDGQSGERVWCAGQRVRERGRKVGAESSLGVGGLKVGRGLVQAEEISVQQQELKTDEGQCRRARGGGSVSVLAHGVLPRPQRASETLVPIICHEQTPITSVPRLCCCASMMPLADPRCHHGRPAPAEAHVFKGPAALRAQRSLAAAWMACRLSASDMCRGGARRRLAPWVGPDRPDHTGRTSFKLPRRLGIKLLGIKLPSRLGMMGYHVGHQRSCRAVQVGIHGSKDAVGCQAWRTAPLSLVNSNLAVDVSRCVAGSQFRTHALKGCG